MQDVVTFAAWKELWRRRRLSAALHVEFWESTPTRVHQTVLQMALGASVCVFYATRTSFYETHTRPPDLLVCCIEDATALADERAAAAALFGHVFALFSAYSVQLGTPKHKIDVDPRSWAALTTIEGIATAGVGATSFPQAAREVRAMLRALEHTENAFLKCLRGFGHQFRVARAAREPETRRNPSDAGLAASDYDTLVRLPRRVLLLLVCGR